jgi:hypothetical protein
MTVLLIVLAATVLVACLNFIERLGQRHELKSTAHQWDEWERLLDGRVTTPLSQESAGVRAEVDYLEAKIARISQENDCLRAERDELRALC